MTRRTTIITLAVFTILSALEDGEANDWAIRDIYGDTTPIFIPDTDSIDLTLKRESRSPGYKIKEKSIGSNPGEFTRDSFIGYGIVWAGRTYIAPKNAQVVITDFLPKYLRNLTGWQDFNSTRSRKSLLSPPLLDGDSFNAFKKLAFADIAPFLTAPRTVRVDNHTIMKVAQGPAFLSDNSNEIISVMHVATGLAATLEQQQKAQSIDAALQKTNALVQAQVQAEAQGQGVTSAQQMPFNRGHLMAALLGDVD